MRIMSSLSLKLLVEEYQLRSRSYALHKKVLGSYLGMSKEGRDNSCLNPGKTLPVSDNNTELGGPVL